MSKETTLKIWDSLKETDPKYTKHFSKGGGFSGTAINPTYGNMKITELFGPAGFGWGKEIIESRFDEGAYLNDRDREVIHTIILKFWYEHPTGGRCEHIGVGTTTFIGKNKYGVFTDEEFFKKSMTDALSNAAKDLGLSADVFMGLYDDSKYVNDIQKKKLVEQTLPKRSEINKDLANMTNIEEFKSYARNFVEKYGSGVWVMASGHPTKKSETIQQLFESHKNRLTGVPPIDTKGPEDSQKEWDSMAQNCSDEGTRETLEKMINQNKALDTEENWAELERIDSELQLA